MLLSDHDIDLIQRYIDNNLSDDELTLVKSRIADKEFYDELKLQKTIASGLEEQQRLKLREELKGSLRNVKIDVDDFREGKSVRWYWAAAAVVALAVVSLIYFLPSPKEAAGSLFQAYYKPYPIAPLVRGDNTQTTEVLEKYNTGDYTGAAELLTGSISKASSEEEKIYLKLLLGNCYLNTNQLQNAMLLFKEVMESKELLLAQHATWYYALALVRNNEIDKAVTVLNDIIELKSMYAGQALELQKSLSKK